MAWVKNRTPITLGSALDDMDITDLTALKFNQFLIHTLDTGGAIDVDVTLDNNGATDYADRTNSNGGTDGTTTSATQMVWGASGTENKFIVSYGINIDSEEKLFIGFEVQQSTDGAATAPDRIEFVSKTDVTTNTGQFTRIDCNNGQAGSYDTSSNLSALGTD